MMRFLRSISTGVANLIRWAPIIWADRDWDWCFLARLMEKKLRRMASHFEQYGHHVNADRDAHRMRICAALLRRMREDNYHDLSGWGKLYRQQGLDLLSFKKFVRHTITAEERQALERISYLEQQDQDLLGRMLGKYLRRWWD